MAKPPGLYAHLKLMWIQTQITWVIWQLRKRWSLVSKSRQYLQNSECSLFVILSCSPVWTRSCTHARASIKRLWFSMEASPPNYKTVYGTRSAQNICEPPIGPSSCDSRHLYAGLDGSPLPHGPLCVRWSLFVIQWGLIGTTGLLSVLQKLYNIIMTP